MKKWFHAGWMIGAVFACTIWVFGAAIGHAQYNVAPAVCTTTNRLPAWDGTSWVCATPVLAVAVTPVTSTQTAKQTLLSQSLPAGYLSANTNCVRITGWGTTKATNNNKTQTIDFGATTVSTTGAVAANNKAWFVTALVCRTGATAQAAFGFAQSDAVIATPTNSTPAETMANAITIAVTSTNVADTDGTTANGLVIERVN